MNSQIKLTFFAAIPVELNNYYPFGLPEAGRSWSYEGRITNENESKYHDYTYGYNGMQRDNAKGLGSGYTTLFREYDPEIARWKSLDPKLKDYPSESPFSAMGNNPIMNTDVLGDNFKYTIENNTITIDVNIYLNDYQFSQRTEDYANEMWNNDGDGWQIEHEGQTYTVLVNVKFVEGHTNNIGENNIYNTKEERAYVKGNTLRDAYCPKGSSRKTVTHEIGHLLGLSDKYRDGIWWDPNITSETRIISIPYLGWKGNIMAQGGGDVEIKNIQRIVAQISDNIKLQKQIGLTIEGDYNAISNSEAAQDGYPVGNSDKLNADHYTNSLATPW